MRKILGIICLTLTLFGTINMFKGEPRDAARTRGRSEAYDAGRKFGAVAAPIVFGVLGLWLLLGGSGSAAPPVLAAPGRRQPSTLGRIFTSKITWLVLAGMVVAMIVTVIGLVVIFRPRPPRFGTAPGGLSDPSPATIRLEGKTATFTNTFGQVFQDIRLVRTDGIVLMYSLPGGGIGTVFLNSIPLPVLDQLGIPTHWPTVQQGRMPQRSMGPVSTAPGAGSMTASMPANGDVQVRWAGRWQPGRIVASRGFSVQVKLEDPAFPMPIWVSTNLVRSR
jgi:hypothetical protein